MLWETSLRGQQHQRLAEMFLVQKPAGCHCVCSRSEETWGVVAGPETLLACLKFEGFFSLSLFFSPKGRQIFLDN